MKNIFNSKFIKIFSLIVLLVAVGAVASVKVNVSFKPNTAQATGVSSPTSATCSDGTTSCGSVYTIFTDLSCSWTNNDSGCTDSNKVAEPLIPAGSSIFRTSVAGNLTGDFCGIGLNIPIPVSGTLFGLGCGGGSQSCSVNGLVENNPPSNSLTAINPAQSPPGPCENGKASGHAQYNLTVCNSGYTASDAYCTKNVTAAVPKLKAQFSNSASEGNTISVDSTGHGSVQLTPGQKTITIPFTFWNSGAPGSIVHVTRCVTAVTSGNLSVPQLPLPCLNLPIDLMAQ